MGEEKWEEQTPHEIEKILGATVTKNFEILKIGGSRAEFLDFDFEIKNFFWKQAVILI